MKAHHTARARRGAHLKQRISAGRRHRCTLQQGWEIIVKHKSARIVGILLTVAAPNARAQWIRCIKGGRIVAFGWLHLTGPRSLHAMRTDEHPLTGQRIETGVLVLCLCWLDCKNE